MANGNSSAAKRARVKLQLRDKKGRWIEMGRGTKWYSSLTGKMMTGTVVGAKGNTAIVALTDNLKPGTTKLDTVDVAMGDLEMIPAKASLLTPEIKQLIADNVKALTGKDLKHYNQREEAIAKGKADQEKAGLPEDSTSEEDNAVQDFIEVDDEDDDETSHPEAKADTDIAPSSDNTVEAQPSAKTKTPSKFVDDPAFEALKDDSLLAPAEAIAPDAKAPTTKVADLKKGDVLLSTVADPSKAEKNPFAKSTAAKDSNGVKIDPNGITGEVQYVKEKNGKPAYAVVKGSDGELYFPAAVHHAVKDDEETQAYLEQLNPTTPEEGQDDSTTAQEAVPSDSAEDSDSTGAQAPETLAEPEGTESTEESPEPQQEVTQEQEEPLTDVTPVEPFEAGKVAINAEDHKKATDVTVGDKVMLTDNNQNVAQLSSAWLGGEPVYVSGKVGVVTSTSDILGKNKTSLGKVVGKNVTFVDPNGEEHTSELYNFAGTNNHYKGAVLDSESLRARLKGEDDDNIAQAAPEEAATETVQDAAPEAVEPGSTVDTAIDVSSWNQVGPQGGSNPGGVFENPEGERFYVKKSKSDEHAKNEVLADKFYEEAGIQTSRLKLADVNGSGKLGTVSKIVDGVQDNFYNKVNNDSDYRAKFQDGYGMDAWLANWDSVGEAYDNAVTDGGGNPVRIDPGGALLYRAMGGAKSEAMFPDTVGEWESMRNGDNNTSAVFGDMTDEQLYNSVQKVAAFTDEKIDELVDSLDFSPESSDRLKTKLKARRDDLVAKADALFPDGPPKQESQDEESSEAPEGVEAPETAPADEEAPETAPEAEEPVGAEAETLEELEDAIANKDYVDFPTLEQVQALPPGSMMSSVKHPNQHLLKTGTNTWTKFTDGDPKLSTRDDSAVAAASAVKMYKLDKPEPVEALSYMDMETMPSGTKFYRKDGKGHYAKEGDKWNAYIADSTEPINLTTNSVQTSINNNKSMFIKVDPNLENATVKSPEVVAQYATPGHIDALKEPPVTGYAPTSKVFDKFPGYNEAESTGLYDYVTGSSINQHLRNPSDADLVHSADSILALNSILDKSPLSGEKKLFRGVRMTKDKLDKLLNSKMYGDLGFTSSSDEFDVAHGWVDRGPHSTDGRVPVVLEMNLPAGFKAHQVDYANSETYEFSNEAETILPYGTEFDVVELKEYTTDGGEKGHHAVLEPILTELNFIGDAVHDTESAGTGDNGSSGNGGDDSGDSTSGAEEPEEQEPTGQPEAPSEDGQAEPDGGPDGDSDTGGSSSQEGSQPSPEAETNEEYQEALATTYPDKGKTVTNPETGEVFSINMMVTSPAFGLGKIVKILPSTNAARIVYKDHGLKTTQAKHLSPYDPDAVPEAPLALDDMNVGETSIDPSNGKMFIVGKGKKSLQVGDTVSYTKKGETKEGTVSAIYKTTSSASVSFPDGTNPTIKASQLTKVENESESEPEAQNVPETSPEPEVISEPEIVESDDAEEVPQAMGEGEFSTRPVGAIVFDNSTGIEYVKIEEDLWRSKNTQEDFSDTEMASFEITDFETAFTSPNVDVDTLDALPEGSKLNSPLYDTTFEKDGEGDWFDSSGNKYGFWNSEELLDTFPEDGWEIVPAAPKANISIGEAESSPNYSTLYNGNDETYHVKDGNVWIDSESGIESSASDLLSDGGQSWEILNPMIETTSLNSPGADWAAERPIGTIVEYSEDTTSSPDLFEKVGDNMWVDLGKNGELAPWSSTYSDADLGDHGYVYEKSQGDGTTKHTPVSFEYNDDDALEGPENTTGEILSKMPVGTKLKTTEVSKTYFEKVGDNSWVSKNDFGVPYSSTILTNNDVAMSDVFDVVDYPEGYDVNAPETVSVADLPVGTFVPNRTGSSTGYTKLSDNEWKMQVTGTPIGIPVTDELVQAIYDVNKPEINLPETQDESSNEAPPQLEEWELELLNYDATKDNSNNSVNPDSFDPMYQLDNVTGDEIIDFGPGTVLTSNNNPDIMFSRDTNGTWSKFTVGGGMETGIFSNEVPADKYNVYPPKTVDAPEEVESEVDIPTPAPIPATNLFETENYEDPYTLIQVNNSSFLDAQPVGTVITTDNSNYSTTHWMKEENGKWTEYVNGLVNGDKGDVPSFDLADGDNYNVYVPFSQEETSVEETPVPETTTSVSEPTHLSDAGPVSDLPIGTKLVNDNLGTFYQKVAENEWQWHNADGVAMTDPDTDSNMSTLQSTSLGTILSVVMPGEAGPNASVTYPESSKKLNPELVPGMPVGTKMTVSMGNYYEKVADNEWQWTSVSGEPLSSYKDSDEAIGGVVGGPDMLDMKISVPSGSNAKVENVLGNESQPDILESESISKPFTEVTLEEFNDAPVGSVVTSASGKTFTKNENGTWKGQNTDGSIFLGDEIDNDIWQAHVGSSSTYSFQAASTEPTFVKKSLSEISEDDLKDLPIGTKITNDNSYIAYYKKEDDNVWQAYEANGDTLYGTIGDDAWASQLNNAETNYYAEYEEDLSKIDSEIGSDADLIAQDAGTNLSGLTVEDIKALPVGTKIDYSLNGKKLGTYERNSLGKWDYTPEGSDKVKAKNISSDSFEYAVGSNIGNNFVIDSSNADDTAIDIEPVDTYVQDGVKPTYTDLDEYPVGTTVKTEKLSYYGATPIYYQKLEDGNWQMYKKTNKTLSKKDIFTSASLASNVMYGNNYTATVSMPKSDNYFTMGTGELGYVGDTVKHGYDTYTVDKILKASVNVTDSSGNKTKLPHKELSAHDHFGLKSSNTVSNQNSNYPVDPITQYVKNKAAAEAAKEALKSFAGASAEEYNEQGVTVKGSADPIVSPLGVLPKAEADTSHPLYGTPKPDAPASMPYIPPFNADSPVLPKWDSADWLKKVEERYLQNPNKKFNSVQDSGYWSKIQDVMNENNFKSNLDTLLSSKYLDDAMYEEATQKYNERQELNKPLIEEFNSNIEQAKATYEAEKAAKEAEYAEKLSEYNTKLEEWATVNPSADALVTPVFPELSTENASPDVTDWSKAHVGTFSVASAMESIKNDNALATHGLSAAVDSDQIEDLDVEFKRIIDKNGNEVIETRFKVTSVHAKAIAAQLEQNPDVKKKGGAAITELKLDPTTGLLKDEGKFKYSKEGNTLYYTDPDTGAEVFFSRPENADNFDPDTHANAVKIRLPKDAQPGDFQKTLENFGIAKARPSTEGDIRVYAENRMMAVFLGDWDTRENKGGDSREKALAKIEEKYGVTIDDVVLHNNSYGNIKLMLTDEAAQKMQDYTNVHRLKHHFFGHEGGKPEDRFFHMVTGVEPGLMSTYQRWQNGIGVGGWSSASDMPSGSGDYIFTQVDHSPNIGNFEAPHVGINAKAVLKRLDIYGNMSDKGDGRRGKNESPTYELMKGNPNEIMYKTGIPISEWAYGYLEADQRKSLIERLKERGILTVNGVPIEEFFITSGMPLPTLPENVSSLGNIV